MAVGLLAALFENIAFLVRFYSCAFVFGSIPYLLLAIHDSNEFSAGDKTHPLEFLPCSDDIPSGTTFEPTTIGPATIYHVRPSGELVDGTVTDLIPGVYGGGKVVWECSIDLANYVFSKPDTLPTDLRSKALELGCGHGIPGMALLLQQYEDVWFSDLNRDVITSYTWPNILKTCPEAATRATCASGDWAHLSEYLTEQNIFFDLIVSAETLYSQNTCKDVANFLAKHLAPGRGRALLANKRFYFGVGGGSFELEHIVTTLQLPLMVSKISEFVDQSSNIRDLLLVRRCDAL